MLTSILSRTRPSQRDRLLALLRSRTPEWVPLTEILDLKISQYGARVLELRRLGYHIENKQEGDCSWFRLVVTKPSTLFGDLSPEPRYPD